MRGARTLCTIQVNNPGGGSGGGGGVTSVTGAAPITSTGGTTPQIGLTTPLSVANGGSGTATPSLVAGANIAVTGSWPNQTIALTNAAATAQNFFSQWRNVTVGGGPGGANVLWITGFNLPWYLTFAHLLFVVTTADSGTNTDLGVYSLAGTLLANLGAVALGSTGLNTKATLQGSQTIAPGNYVFAVTSSTGTAKFGYDNQNYGPIVNLSYGSSSGGVLPNSISAPSVSPAQFPIYFGLY